ncbi:MAG: GNAT family N-acetyltransferase [Chitinophagales bacterium]
MQQLILFLEQHLQTVPTQLQKIPSTVLEQKPQPHKWSKKEILGHLVDSAQNNLRRFVEIQYSAEPYQIQGYAQDDCVRINAYQQMPIQAVMQLWLNINQQIVRIWKQMPPEKLPLKVWNTDGSESTLQWWISDYVRHLEHHLHQIFDDIEAIEETSQNNTREQFIQENCRIDAATALGKLTNRTDGKRFVETLQHGSMVVEIYQPDKMDLQTPHTRDELYVVYRGRGIFFNDGVRHSFEAGDVLFVPAGVEHRFEDFSDDFVTWVVFYGPEGGEAKLKKGKSVNPFIAEKGRYQISTNDSLLDIEYIFQYLHKESYWAKNVPKAIVEKSLQNSLNFGLYHHEQQIGFARVITDCATFAYLADVFVEEGFRGQGLALWLTQTILDYPDLQGLRRWMLMTETAQNLYKKADFQIAAHPGRVMEKLTPNPY